MTSKLRLFALLSLFVAVAAGAEEKRADEMPALTAKSIVVTPAYPQPEEPAEVVLTIRNSATAPADDVEVLFYANGDLLTSRTVNIAAMSSATVTVPWMAKSAGSTTIVAKVDPRQVLVERDRYDNALGLDVVASAPPAVEADFAVTAIEVLAPAESPGVVRVDVANEGTVAASAPLVLRRNGQPVQAVDSGVIEAGKSTTIEVAWSDPDRGRMSAEVNPRWAEAEPNAKNNTLAASVAGGVDLRIEQLTFHATQSEDGRTRRVGVSFRVVNDGAQDVKQPFRTRIHPGAVDQDGKLVPAYVTTGALPAGGTVYVTHIFESAPDKFTVHAEADAEKVIGEANEQNNIEVKDFYNDLTLDPDRWVNIGPRRVGDSHSHHTTGRLSTMAIHPTQTSTMYVGAKLSGVWKTSDSGASWTPVADAATVSVAALALAPDNPSRVYLVTRFDGVYRSDDAGTSWMQISPMDLAAMVHAGSKLLINPDSPNVMLVSSERGVYRSSDGGVTWMQTLFGGACGSLIRMSGNGRIYAALSNRDFANLAGVYESVNWGASWSLVPHCPAGALPTADAMANIRLAVSGSRLFVSYQQGGDPKTFRLFRSTSLTCGAVAGPTFELAFQPDSGTASALWSGLFAEPGTDNLYMTGTTLWRSTDGGGSFSRTSTGPGGAHDDHHYVGIDPNTPSTIYTLSDGGIYRSTNRGASGSWVQIGDTGITNIEFYDGVAAPTNASIVIGGNHDNGTVKGTAGFPSWRMFRGGDGATVDIDPTDSSIVYTMFQYAASVMRSTTGGPDPMPAANGLPTGAACYLMHYQIHPGQPTTLVASCGALWRTTDSGANWSVLFDPANDFVRTAIDGPADTYYAGTNIGDIHMGTGGGQDWRAIFDHPSNFALTDLEINRADPSRLYASFNSGSEERIIRLVRSSTGDFTWRDITSDLPEGLVVRTIAIDKNYPLTIYAGTDRGVYQGRSINHGLTWFWRPYMNGLPPADVRDLEVHPATGIMRAFTHGRGAYEVTTSRATGGDEVE